MQIDQASPERLWQAVLSYQEEQRDKNRRAIYIGWEASGRAFNLEKQYEAAGLADPKSEIASKSEPEPITAQERIDRAQALILKMREKPRNETV